MRELRRFPGMILLFSLLAAPAGAAGRPAAPAPEHIVAFTFDWDDNVFEMPTQIWLFHRLTGEERGVSTEDFALIREDLGKPGTAWADYELRADPRTGSLRDFGDASAEGSHSFQRDIEEAMKGEGWKGPVWSDFVTATSRIRTARRTSFITARLHSPETIHTALRNFKKMGLIAHVPPYENVWPVSWAGFPDRYARVFGEPAPGGSTANPSARKAAVMEQMLDRIERTPLPSSAPKVLSPDGRSRGRYHLWGFSDDDLGNFTKAIDVLQKGVDARRWPHVKITVFYTGTNRPEVVPHAVTLVRRARPRPHREGSREWKDVLRARDGRLMRLSGS